jgi:(2Fe-2S) ferredoxin
MRAHVLVCRGPDCAARGGEDVYTQVAWEVEHAGLSDEVVQTQCGCVGPLCGGGPVVCCYPTGAWYAAVGPADVAEIVRRDLGLGEVVHELAAAQVQGAA